MKRSRTVARLLGASLLVSSAGLLASQPASAVGENCEADVQEAGFSPVDPMYAHLKELCEQGVIIFPDYCEGGIPVLPGFETSTICDPPPGA